MKKTTAFNYLRRAAAFLVALALAVPVGYARAGDRHVGLSSVETACVNNNATGTGAEGNAIYN